MRKKEKNNILISAILVTYNEDKFLDDCLSGLKFCDEIVVVDLGSSDNTKTIARKYADKVIDHKRIYQVEEVHAEIVHRLKNDLILITDPDEIMEEGLSFDILDAISKNPNAAQLNAPIQYYFKGRKLHGTVWGGEKYRKIIVDRKKVNFKPRVHRGVLYKDKNPKIINIKSKYIIKHYWANSYKELFEKHRRYLRLEGKSRYDNGERYNLKNKLKESARAVYDGLIRNRGFISGPAGIFLSLFYGWYIWQANNSLKKYENPD